MLLGYINLFIFWKTKMGILNESIQQNECENLNKSRIFGCSSNCLKSAQVEFIGPGNWEIERTHMWSLEIFADVVRSSWVIFHQNKNCFLTFNSLFATLMT